MATDDMLPDRFWDKVDLFAENGCWKWMASTGRGGYGRYAVTPRMIRYAHRLAYESLVGPVPSGLELDHLCRNPPCVNPDHLEPVTRRVNTLRGNSPAAKNARKTHCKRGHDDWRPQPGGRVCATCVKQANVRYRSRQKAESD